MALSRILFCLSLHRFCWLIEGERLLRIQRRSRGLFVSDLPAVSFPQMASPPATSREGSLTTAVFRFSGTVPDEPPSGCRRTGYVINFVPCFHISLEQRFHLKSFSFLSSGRLEPISTPRFAPLQCSGTRSKSSTRLDPNFVGGSSLYSSPKVVLFSSAWILLNGYTVHLRQSFSGDLFHGTVEWPRSDASRSEHSGLDFNYVWAWPIETTKTASPKFSLIKPKFKKEDAIHITMGLAVWVKLIEISGGFTGISFQCILSYLSFGMNSPKCLLPSFLLSMKGDVFSVSLSRYSSSFFTVLSSCVAVSIRLHRESLIDAVKLGLDFVVIIFF
uniref:Uncharacterized protein n=1 Tax=Brassica oleracea TaxID=3712 RepID=A0A3P6FYT3_BRAOL|nr:unnamed protein product [Brassica oleracea]